MKKKIIVLGIIILLIGVIAPQSGAVQELDGQQNTLQAPLEEETYGPYLYGEVYIGDTDSANLTFEWKMAVRNFYFGVTIKATIGEDGGYIGSKLRFFQPVIQFDEGDEVTITCPILNHYSNWTHDGNAGCIVRGFSIKAEVTKAPED